jgi:RES domain-containing protein
MFNKPAMKAIYGAVGNLMPAGRKANQALASHMALPVGMRGAGSTAKRLALQRTAKATALQAGKKPTLIGMGVLGAGAMTAARPNSNQSRTAYRGPMQTGRGVGRFA